MPLITGEATSIREWALAGIWGKWVHVIDGKHKYVRGPVTDDNLPLSMWSNRWSTMPIPQTPNVLLPKPNANAYLDFMPGSSVPVIRQPFQPGDMLPYWAQGHRPGWHHLFNLDDDPDELEDRLGEPREKEMIDLLRAALESVGAPAEQFTRLGIA